ncbi:2OG-Fe(II) oxygenase [Streptomyces sp. NPDC005065]|uniref:2OG-Fe(II) oxygenase n=1 Tax=unclassified Streptomyces TaxID=2593676 RepID=UPI0033A6F4A1
MSRPPRHHIARLLDDTSPTGTFSTELSLPASDLRLDVDGFGPLPFPLRADKVKRLIATARRAKFGKGEATLSDPSVRDTWELTPEQFTVGGDRWQARLDSALDQIQDRLGLSPAARLTARPHSLLLYGKGQFFLPHQDSEKDDAMIGTLVVSLPTTHSGGELVIHHGGTSRSYRASADDLGLVAFYADCRHEVTPVTRGYRVTLTFDLLVEKPAGDGAAGPGPVAEVAACLTSHFTTPATPRYSYRPLPPPGRLVHLLDHEYTRRSLHWDQLKGADQHHAAVLRAAAEAADCEAVLALVDVKETWDAYPEGEDPWDRYDSSYYYDDDDDEDVAEAGNRTSSEPEYVLNDLIDDEVTLTWWTLPGRRGGESVALHVPDEELCATTPNKALKPYESAYEGYMGNYGNTLDRWYHRSAVVLWPREQAFATRAEARPAEALDDLHQRLTSGDTAAAARTDAASLEPFWSGVVASTVRAGTTSTGPAYGSGSGDGDGDGDGAADGTSLDRMLGLALRIAPLLDDPALAATLLSPLPLESLTPAHADALATACTHHGAQWSGPLLSAWFGEPSRHMDRGRREWTRHLPGIVRALEAAGAGQAAQQLTAETWKWLDSLLKYWTTVRHTAQRTPSLAGLAAPLARLSRCAGGSLPATIRKTLRGYDDTVLECMVPAVLTPRPQDDPGPPMSGPPGPGITDGLTTALAHDCVERLEALLARPERTADDWSITWSAHPPERGRGQRRGPAPHTGPAGCGCELCTTLESFLTSPTRCSHEWPLAQPRRQHIHQLIDTAALPVRHVTRRLGRPYTLVLTKTDRLFTDERDRRTRAAADLTRLRALLADGTAPTGKG